MYRKEKMERYNKHLADEMLRRQMAFIDHTPQPTMFGGVRPRSFVLPITTEYDYPSTLAVGRVSGRYPDKMDGSFWSDALEGGMSARAFQKSLKKVGKVAVPIGSKVAKNEGEKTLDNFLSGSGMEYDEEEEMSSSDEEEEESDSDMEGGMMHGGKKKYGLSRLLKDINKTTKSLGIRKDLRKIADAGTDKAVEKIKGGKKYGLSRLLKDINKTTKSLGIRKDLRKIADAGTDKAVEKISGAGFEGPLKGRRGRPRKMKSAVMSMEDLGMEGGKKKKYGLSRLLKDINKTTKSLGIRKYLRQIADAGVEKGIEKIKGAGRRGRPRKCGGALLSGEDEGLTGAYPPALSTVYKGAGAKGGRGARAEIVKKVMKEKGLSLPQASKYVKEKGLY
jgi:hypothetical protein